MAFDQVSGNTTLPDENSPRFIISVDYGTTYTGAAWVLTKGEVPKLSDINVVQNWGGGIKEKVPSKFTYSANTGEQWGFGIGDNAYVIQRTKLELVRPSRVDALDRLRRMLLEASLLGFSSQSVVRGQLPRHLIKTPSDVVTDYLREVARWVRRDIESKRDKETLHQFPIDYVITHPAEWDSRGRNLTFRAVNAAFGSIFHEATKKPGYIRLASESEACAQYTMSDPEDGAVNDLLVGECFIVVDAGGGTVDLAAYKVEEVAPNFRVSLVTQVTGDKCGSSNIDDYFIKEFLPARLSDQDLRSLRNMGGHQEQHGSASHEVLRRGEQMMLEDFMTIKHNFKGKLDNGQPSETDWIELPTEIDAEDDPVNNIRNGYLGITCDDMEEMFRDSVRRTIRLITGQRAQIDYHHLQLRAIFLSGGFSRSPYLYNHIKNIAQGWSVNLFRGNDSWTAVTKGAALMGLGIGCGEIPPPNLKCPFHVGLVAATRFTEFDHDSSQQYTDTFDGVARARNHIQWVVARGDLVTRDEGIQERVLVVCKHKPRGKKTGHVTVVTSRHDGNDEVPSKLGIERDASRREFELDYDLSIISPEELRRHPAKYRTMNQAGKVWYQVEIEVHISVTQLGCKVDLLWGRTETTRGICLHSSDIPFPA